jgi:hypothetical protein
MSYVQRAIDVTFLKGLGDKGENGFALPVTYSDLRMSATVEVWGMPSLTRLALRMYGMTQSQMNEWTRAGVLPTAQRNNVVSVNAGDAGVNPALVFKGIIGWAYQDLQAAPDVSFNVNGWVGLLNHMKPSAPTSYTGSADVATIMGALAAQMGYALEPNGVNVKLVNPYFWGTPRQQVEQCAYAANIFAYIENEATLVLLDKNKVRQKDYVVPINANTGMVGYPNAIAPGNFRVRTVFNPDVLFLGQIDVQSSIKPMCGTYRVRSITHTIECQMPEGAWFTDIGYSMFGAQDLTQFAGTA